MYRSSTALLQRIAVVASVLVLLFVASDARAQTVIPHTLSYQGLLLDSTGIAVCDSTWNMEFYLYQNGVGGSPFWSEQHSVRTKLAASQVKYVTESSTDTTKDSPESISCVDTWFR